MKIRLQSNLKIIISVQNFRLLRFLIICSNNRVYMMSCIQIFNILTFYTGNYSSKELLQCLKYLTKGQEPCILLLNSWIVSFSYQNLILFLIVLLVCIQLLAFWLQVSTMKLMIDWFSYKMFKTTFLALKV